MSSTIWTTTAGKSKLALLSQTAWRIIEDQTHNFTRRLVSSDQEQARLENAKPPRASGPEWAHFHYLLFTPFRYTSRWDSRFRSRSDPGVWYGSTTLETAIAESAFQRLRFLNSMEAPLQLDLTLTGFSTRLRSRRAADLTAPPFDKFRSLISNPASYADSQALAADMRRDGVEFCRYRSARAEGMNVAVFYPAAFAERTVPDNSRETLTCFGDRNAVELRWHRFSGDRTFRFERAQFEIDGRFPLITG